MGLPAAVTATLVTGALEEYQYDTLQAALQASWDDLAIQSKEEWTVGEWLALHGLSDYHQALVAEG